jgi:hypothetical protein
MRRRLAAVFLLGWCLSGAAQDYEAAYFGGSTVGSMPSRLRHRPQSLDDFIGRYNGRHDAGGQVLDPDRPPYRDIAVRAEYRREFRRLIIGALVAPARMARDSAAAERFAAAAAAGPALDFLTTRWWVEVPLEGYWQGLPLRIDLHLRVVADEQGRVRWVMDRAVFEGSPPAVTAGPLEPVFRADRYLPPSAHDNGFIALQRVLEVERDLRPYLDTGTGPGLATLQYLLQETAFQPVFHTFTACFRPESGPAFQLNPQWQIIGF